MERAPITVDLPPPLALSMRPWIGVVEAAAPGMGKEVRAVAANVTVSLLRRIVLTPSLETAIEKARLATAALATALDRDDPASPTVRSDARAALDALIGQLRAARPNEHARGLGLGW